MDVVDELVADNLASTARTMDEISVSIFTYCRRRLNGMEGEMKSSDWFSSVLFFGVDEEVDTPIFPISFSKNSLKVIAMVVLEIIFSYRSQSNLHPICRLVVQYRVIKNKSNKFNKFFLGMNFTCFEFLADCSKIHGVFNNIKVVGNV